MSRHSSHERALENTEVLEVIREEQCSPAVSSVNMDAVSKTVAEAPKACVDCTCLNDLEKMKDSKNPEEIERMMLEREAVLRREFLQKLEGETNDLKDKFDYILQNEQVRTSFMLREAHRERQEKIGALQTQLECKNLAGVMYVMCTERRKSKLERLRLIQEYTNYIRALQTILADGQELILRLSRGYKTAARVDHEWREKMKMVIKEFQAYVYHFSGGTPESNQYLFDLPALLKTEASVYDDPKEDPIEEPDHEGEEEEAEDPNAEKPWWELIEGECKPFIMFGDMAEFRPPQRREVLKAVKAAATAPRQWKEYVGKLLSEDQRSSHLNAEKPWWELIEGECKPFIMFGDMAEFRPPQRMEVLKAVKAAATAPRQWKEYVFNEMFLRADCSNADVIKDEYPNRVPPPGKWECQAVQTDRQFSKMSISSRRVTTTSMDVRGNMGSILKIITSNIAPEAPNKPNILAARDSMEIASTTKLRDKHHHKHTDPARVVINVGSRRTSMFKQDLEDTSDEVGTSQQKKEQKDLDDEEEDESLSLLGSIHNDSLHVIPSHVPEKDHKIHYEKVCPMEKCQRMEVDSFIRSLPPYMRANPFTHFEQSYEDYETCTKEQLEILKKRIEDKKNKEKPDHPGLEESPLAEWNPEVEGVGVQTSDASLPPCTCRVPSPTPVSSAGRMFDMQDLIPIKQNLDAIRKDCFYDGGIEFDRFKVIGQESDYTINEAPKEDFKKTRLYEIKRILKQHPSLCEIFQANTRC
ncbi:uncharacterized protein LOC135083664 [Ostrinia nubilalis]|uniref:uncharacterized protein LOC135083664 n=1 Tax=Ostrinia nubilalis TaxID=29057 RepID=UPI0030822E81